MKRLVRAYCSIDFNNDVQEHIITNDKRFDNEYIVIAKLILTRIPILPTNERVLRLAQDIEKGKFNDLPDIDNNLDLWAERATQLLKDNNILLGE
jgi:ABC-type uncharacterized transport system ATPase component